MSNFPPALVFDKPITGLLTPQERADIATAALGQHSISQLARDHRTSRKFVRTQRDKAKDAIQSAFSPHKDDHEVLFYLPVTKAWLRQFVLVLIFVCKASYRNVIDSMDSLLDSHISLGSIHNIICTTHQTVADIESDEDLSPIRVGAPDEIYLGNTPVLTAVGVDSGYCYMLSEQDCCDGDTWALLLMEAADHGLQLEYAIADFGKGLRAGHKEACPALPLLGDHFHVLAPMTKMEQFIKRRAYKALEALDVLERKMGRAKKRGVGNKHSRDLGHKRQEAEAAVELYDDIRLLCRWFGQDVLGPAGPSAPEREELYDFIIEELAARESQCAHRLKPIITTLRNVKVEALLWAKQLDEGIAEIAQRWCVQVSDVRSMVQNEAKVCGTQAYFGAQAHARKSLGELWWPVHAEVIEMLSSLKRGSGDVENLNGRLRPYFDLRRKLGPKYLQVLRFFMNHHRQPRSRRRGGSGKSPAERLWGTRFPNWLEQLGYELFKKAA